jgi:hypothetical protein
LQDPISKKKKKSPKRAQGVGPEFKPQQKKKRKGSWYFWNFMDSVVGGEMIDK